MIAKEHVVKDDIILLLSSIDAKFKYLKNYDIADKLKLDYNLVRTTAPYDQAWRVGSSNLIRALQQLYDTLGN